VCVYIYIYDISSLRVKVGNDGAAAFEMLVTSFWGADSGKESSS